MRVVLRADLGSAMRKREVRRINALRGLIAAIDNAEAVPLGDTGDDSEMRTRAVSAHMAVTGSGPSEVPRRLLSKPEVTAILKNELESYRAAAAELRAHGSIARAEEIEAEALIVASYINETRGS
jgi:hypothetical protein